MPAATHRTTYGEIRRMPHDGKRYELIDGEVYVTPSPNTKHQRVVGNLYLALREFVDEHGLGDVYLAPLDVVFDEYDVLQPDLLFVSSARRSIIGEDNVTAAPDLVVEILSPSTRGYDRDEKRRVYARFGVKEVWLFEPRDNTVELLSLTPSGDYAPARKLSGGDTITSQVIPGLQLPLKRVFG